MSGSHKKVLVYEKVVYEQNILHSIIQGEYIDDERIKIPEHVYGITATYVTDYIRYLEEYIGCIKDQANKIAETQYLLNKSEESDDE